MSVRSFIKSWRESTRCLHDETISNGFVVYSEGDAYSPFLRPVIDALADEHDGVVFYLTSDPNDRILQSEPSHVRGFYIGKGSARTYALNGLKANVVAMTMPDINTFHIKRSPNVRHYVYLHHSLVSTHMVYRKGAFDSFDSIFCAGPHHDHETREWEALKGLPPKQLHKHGYAPLDALIDAARNDTAMPAHRDQGLNILLAPSWGPAGVMETRSQEIVKILLDAGHRVNVRPHPRTRQLSGPVLDALAKKFAQHPGFEMNENTTQFEALMQAHVMISDWSGVAMEFAFGLEKPVLFVDVPRKINNPEYTELAATPLEVSYREAVGSIIQPDRLDEIPAALTSLQDSSHAFQAHVRELRERYFYNVGASASHGAKMLAELARRAKEQA